MDWRERNYYLIRTNWDEYAMRHDIYKIAAPSIKYYAPYGHCTFKKLGFIKLKPWRFYDGYSPSIPSFINPQEMISCRKEHSEALEYELRKSQRNGGNFVKLNKEILGQ